MKFKPGQEVVCIANTWWVENTTVGFWFWKKRKPSNGPKYNEIVTVERYSDNSHILLIEYPACGSDRNSYAENCFELVVSQEEVDKLMQEIAVKNEYMQMAQNFLLI